MLSDSEKLERLFELYEKKMYATAFQILQEMCIRDRYVCWQGTGKAR